MPAGLECFDSLGRSVISVTTRITRILGNVTTGIANGSISNPGFSQGTAYYLVLGQDVGLLSPTISISGNTLSWSWESTIPNEYRDSAEIQYGVY